MRGPWSLGLYYFPELCSQECSPGLGGHTLWFQSLFCSDLLCDSQQVSASLSLCLDGVQTVSPSIHGLPSEDVHQTCPWSGDPWRSPSVLPTP